MAEYKTIRTAASAEFTEKRSQFIGYISPAENEQQALDFINSIRAQHRKATHNCYAYILRENNTARHSDDGEPGGTAGVPIYDALRKAGVTDIACVVTRYFGGIQLGAGGLVRAYTKGAVIALEAAEIITYDMADSVEIVCDYALYSAVNAVLMQYGAMIAESDFSHEVRLIADVRCGFTDAMLDEITEISCGKARLKRLSAGYREFKKSQQ